ncbi:hypothetical protein ACFO4N_03345 [Camelliibacillus cellulosilyticus]|uniref:Uncharacterized protein n=1 Tax=Camelliibacillus cellulosilyticus TaxID=2174486 RepID=A0ABV9GHI4_9BACL
MLAEKMIQKAQEQKTDYRTVADRYIRRLEKMNPEDIVGTLANVMFKLVLFFGIPYFLFVFVKFLLL